MQALVWPPQNRCEPNHTAHVAIAPSLIWDEAAGDQWSHVQPGCPSCSR